jgi:hypothetical protein
LLQYLLLGSSQNDAPVTRKDLMPQFDSGVIHR